MGIINYLKQKAEKITLKEKTTLKNIAYLIKMNWQS